MCGRSAGRSGGRTMVFAPGLSHVYRAYRRKIPALVLGGPPFILSSRSGVYSSAPPLLSLSKAVSFTCVLTPVKNGAIMAGVGRCQGSTRARWQGRSTNSK